MAAPSGSPPGPGLSRQSRQSWPRLDPDTAEYFRRALEMLEEGLSQEDLALFTRAVLSEAARAGPALPLHPRGSRLLQAALGGLPGVLGAPGVPGEGLRAALGELAALLAEDPGGFARHPQGSFVLRALLAVLGGGAPADPPRKGAEPKPKGAWPKPKGAWSLPEGAELPPSFRPLLEELAKGLEREMPTLLTPPCASLCLQGALSALHRSQSPYCAQFCRALIGCLGQDGPAHGQSALLTSLHDPARSHLLEAAMTVLDPPGLRELFRGHLRGHLRGVASHRVANHGLQRLLERAPEDVVQEALSELGPALQEPLARGHPGVLIALLGAARRHPRLQGEALRWLFQALRCWAPPHHPHCLTALAQLRPLEDGDGKEGAEPKPLPALSLWGSLALQELLRFGDPSPVWGSLRSLRPPQLLELARSAPGSRLWEALLSAPGAPPGAPKRLLRKLRGREPPVGGAAERPRSAPGSRLWEALLSAPGAPPGAPKRLLRKLRGHWLELAQHRSGSRVLDAAWARSGARGRERMAAELAPRLPELLRDPHGRGVARNLALELFRSSRRRWERLQQGRGLGRATPTRATPTRATPPPGPRPR